MVQGRVCTEENELRVRSQVCRGGPAPVPADPCLVPHPQSAYSGLAWSNHPYLSLTLSR